MRLRMQCLSNKNNTNLLKWQGYELQAFYRSCHELNNLHEICNKSVNHKILYPPPP